MNKLMIKHNDHGVEGTDIFVELCAMPDSYEKIRPGYPDELYQALFAYPDPEKSIPAIQAVL